MDRRVLTRVAATTLAGITVLLVVSAGTAAASADDERCSNYHGICVSVDALNHLLKPAPHPKR